MRTLLPLTMTLFACDARMAEDADWFGDMGALDQDVLEPVAFTEDDYDFDGDGLASLDGIFTDFDHTYSPMADPTEGCPDFVVSNELPIETWAMVTLHPRMYFKTGGCDAGSDEKFYGNYFLEDDSGGYFVLNDSKVAHFEMGDRVRVRIDGVAERFNLEMVTAHTVLEVDRGPHPIKWRWAGETVPTGSREYEYVDTEAMLGRVVRVEGIVVNEPDTFGQFQVRDDDGFTHTIALDTEINRRKVRAPVGSRLRATGPVHNAFGHNVRIMRIGQLERL